MTTDNTTDFQYLMMGVIFMITFIAVILFVVARLESTNKALEEENERLKEKLAKRKPSCTAINGMRPQFPVYDEAGDVRLLSDGEQKSLSAGFDQIKTQAMARVKEDNDIMQRQFWGTSPADHILGKK